MRWIFLALAFALVLPGCAEVPGGPAPLVSAAPIVAFADVSEEGGINRTILILREGGEADRLTYLGDGSWVPRLAPGLAFPAEDLAAVFAKTSPTWERGGLVFRIERGSVPENATEALRPFLDGAWPDPFVPPGVPHPWYRPLVLVRADPYAATEGPDEGLEHDTDEHGDLRDLVAAFTTARRAFAPASVEETDVLAQPPWDGCLRATTTVTPEAANVGDLIEVRADVTNCGSTEIALDPRACTHPPSIVVQVGGSVMPMLAALPATDEPSAAYALDLVCRGDDDAVTIPAGGTVSLARRWNGTFAACRSPSDCEFRRAEPAEYGLVTFAPGQMEAGHAGVTLLDPQAESTPLLVVREYEWVNSTSSDSIYANYGPHCAPVSYRTDPAAVTIWYYDERPALGDGVVVRDWRDGERPSGVHTFSADRLDVVFLANGNATLASPYEGAPPLMDVRREGDDFLVNGTRLAPGGTHTERIERAFPHPDGAHETTSILVFENVGRASVLWARAGGCA